MTLVVTHEQTFPLYAVPPLTTLYAGLGDDLFKGNCFRTDLWFGDDRRFDIEVSHFAIRLQKDNKSPRIEMEGTLTEEYMPNNDDDDLWEPLPQATSFRASFDTASTPIKNINDMVRVTGEVTVYPTPTQ